MRISDWSSDVCSSDLGQVRQAVELLHDTLRGRAGAAGDMDQPRRPRHIDAALDRMNPRRTGERHNDAGGSENTEAAENPEPGIPGLQIGRASCRERVCQYV